MMTAENKGLEFDRIQILNRYWELANLKAELTKENILGQLKALDSLCEQMSLAVTEKPRQPPRALEIYRSAWMQPREETPVRKLQADEADSKMSREALKKTRPFPTTQ